MSPRPAGALFFRHDAAHDDRFRRPPNPGRLAALLPLFFDLASQTLDAAHAALDQGDLDQARRQGHKLKGSAGSYGFPELAKAAAALERAADAGNANAYDALCLVADAIRRAGSAEPAAIRDALAATEGFSGVTGTISFRGGRDPVKPMVVLRITPDAVEFVKKVEP